MLVLGIFIILQPVLLGIFVHLRDIRRAVFVREGKQVGDVEFDRVGTISTTCNRLDGCDLDVTIHTRAGRILAAIVQRQTYPWLGVEDAACAKLFLIDDIENVAGFA